MTLHDLRNKIYKENDIIKNNFPLRLGGFDLEIDQNYNLESNFNLTHRYWVRNLSMQIKIFLRQKFF
jgi:hypothetical protein